MKIHLSCFIIEIRIFLEQGMLIFYYVCVLLSIIIYLGFYITDVKKSLCQNVMVLIMMLSNAGYLSLALSTNLESAIISNKIIYLGASFLPILYFFNVCEVCHHRLSKKIIVPLLIFQIIIYLSSLTVGFSDLFYKNVEFQIIDGIGSLVNKKYGIFHTFSLFTMYFYMIASFFVVIFSILRKKSVHRREIYFMLFLLGISILAYVVQRIFLFTADIMPLIFIPAILGALIPIYNSNLFTVNENQNIIREQMDNIGFIVFNKKMEYMGTNDFALKLFPELKNYKVGEKIKSPSKELKEIISSIENFKAKLKISDLHSHSNSKPLMIGAQFFDTKIHTIDNFRGKCAGFTLEMKDATEHYRILQIREKFNEELKTEVENKTQKIREIQNKIVLGMAQMVESRDLSTGGHIKRTSDVVKIFSKKLLNSKLGFDRHFLNLVVRSAPMHDLGKIGVDDAVLRKQGKFTDEEYAKMKIHPVVGGYLVKQILSGAEEDEFVQIAYNVAKFHHEKVNGKGYPDGLKGDEIPIEARIMALADVFDALVSKRCYKDAFSYEKAFEIIKEDSGSHFDSTLAAVFLNCKNELIDYYNKNK